MYPTVSFVSPVGEAALLSLGDAAALGDTDTTASGEADVVLPLDVLQADTSTAIITTANIKDATLFAFSIFYLLS